MDFIKEMEWRGMIHDSTPGLSEVLQSDQDFETFKGFPIQVTYTHKDKSQKNQNGLLHSRSKEHLVLNTKGKITKIKRDDVLEVRLTSSTG